MPDPVDVLNHCFNKQGNGTPFRLGVTSEEEWEAST